MIRFIILFLAFPISAFGQDENHDQKLADMLATQNYAEAEVYYTQYSENITSKAIINCYEALMTAYHGDSYSTISKINRILTENQYDIDFVSQVLYLTLIQCYVNINNYAQAIETCEQYINFIQTSPIHGNETQKKLHIEWVEEQKVIIAGYAKLNYDQNLADLLVNEQRCFDAEDYYSQYADSLKEEFIKQFYHVKMDMFYNRPDSAIIKINNIIDSHKFDTPNHLIPAFLYDPLIQSYYHTGNYSKAASVCEKYLRFIETSAIYNDEPVKNRLIKDISAKKRLFSDLSEIPPIQIKKGTKDSHIQLDTSYPFFLFKAKFNADSLNVLLDTGCNYHFFLDKTIADKIGVKIIQKDSINIINNKETKSQYGILNSFQIGNIQIKDVPVMVVYESWESQMPDSLKHKTESYIMPFFQSFDLVMGLPIMRLLEYIEFDLNKKQMNIPANNIPHVGKRNMYLTSKNIHWDLFVKSQLNDIEFIPFIDTGGGFSIFINETYYQHHKDKIPIISNDENAPLNLFLYNTGPLRDISNKKPYPINLTIDNLDTELGGDDDVYILPSGDILPSGGSDGLIGISVFYKYEKVIFNFRDMALSVF